MTLNYPIKNKKRKVHCFFYTLAMIIVSLFIASLAILTYTPRSEYKIWSLINNNSSESLSEKVKLMKDREIYQIRYNLVVVFLSTVTLIIFVFLIAFVCRSSYVSSAVQVFRLIFFVAFTKLPQQNSEIETINRSLFDSSKTSFEISHEETFDQRVRFIILYIIINKFFLSYCLFTIQSNNYYF